MNTLVQNAPCFSAVDAERLARELYGIEATASALASERDQNFRLGDYVLKIANRDESREMLELQNQVIALLQERAPELEWPRVIGEIAAAGPYLVRLLTWVPGKCLVHVPAHSAELLRSLGRALAAMDLALAGFDHPAAHRAMYWDVRQASLARRHTRLLTEEQRVIVEPVFEAWDAIDWSKLPESVIHGDANDYNVLTDEGGARVVSVLDFGDVVYSATICNLAVAIAYAMLDKRDPVAAAAQVVEGYVEARPLSEAEADALFPLAATRLAISVCNCAWQASQAPENEYLKISNRPAWALLARIGEWPKGWPTEVMRHAAGLDGGRPADALLESRKAHLGPSLSISYREPLHILRGWRQHLYDSAGREYLDCVNNVTHVGHCHPRVAEAVARQMGRLNTNTRYLYDGLVEYIERLTATMPAPLSVVYLVCSGSEANELALRLARAHTGRDGMIVVETAYHGNTNALIDISPYKFDGPGGRGKPAHVQVLPMPDVYREGRRTACPTFLGAPAAFICESALSCAGQVILPAGYLQAAYEAVREAGGVCIADEVQTGFGRAGSHFWMFETQGVVPDIVTLGKPAGNGHPLGAVITTPEIARSFANGMEYFNTFGGNPVSCAAGLAVLDVIREEGLQEHALATGNYLMDRLRDVATRVPAIGDVRGKGLFLGFELVRDRETKEPAADLASELVNRMKEEGVLLSTDGPLHNVIKIKPPMVFTKRDADRVAEGVERLIG